MVKVKQVVEENKDAAEFLEKAIEEGVCSLDDDLDTCLEKVEKERKK